MGISSDGTHRLNQELINAIKNCPTLPTLPAVAIEILELTQTEQVDLNEIARTITKDPALSSKILRTVNSSFYQRSHSVSTISHALVILGLQAVRTLVLGFSLTHNLNTKAASDHGFKHLDYWRRSIYSATAARTLASKIGLVQQEEVFLAALLQDIGMLVLDQTLGQQYGKLCAGAATHEQLLKVETEHLGMSHADVSGLMAELWKLPPVLSAPVAYHHRPSEVADPQLRKLAEVCHVAGRCSDIFVYEEADAIKSVRESCKAWFNIEESRCDELMDEIGKRTREVAPLFQITLGPGVSFESILKKANETLVELTLRTQQQASTLQEQNHELKKQATTDALTGLANRAKFDKFITDQFTYAQGIKKPLALLMLDLDRFKQVNDTHGHPAGDQVLRVVSKLLRNAARSQDLAARYGGEEMTLVLPGTGRTTAAAIAESIRRAIEARPVAFGSSRLPITTSVGVAVYEPDVPLKSAAQLIKAADMALYAAKQGGRNCVKIFSFKAATKAA